MALFVHDDKRATVRSMSFTDIFAHHFASAFRSFFAYRVQVVELGPFQIANCLLFIFDVEEVTWHRSAPIFRIGRAAHIFDALSTRSSLQAHDAATEPEPTS